MSPASPTLGETTDQATSVEQAALDALAGIPAFIRDGIRAADEPPFKEAFIPGRWPYTYAYDFVREHAHHFQAPASMSRAETAGWLRERCRNRATADLAAVELARAYCRSRNIDIPAEFA